MSAKDSQEKELNFKDLFVPLTTIKAIHIIIFVGLIVYANGLFNSFVFDDTGSIVTNPGVHSLANIPNLFAKQLTGFDANIFYRPIPFIVYNIIFSFYGATSFYYHIVQLFLHIGNTLLIFFIFKRFLKLPIAFIVSLLYLIHPINQEAVVYISALPEALFVHFGLLALYLLQKTRTKSLYIIAANIFLFLALLSKESGVLFIVVGFLFAFFFQRKKIVFYLCCSLAISMVYIVLRMNANIQYPEIAVVPMINMPFIERMKSVPEIILFYITNLTWPIHITYTNSWVVTKITITNFFIPLLLDSIFFVVLFVLSFSIRTKNRKLVFFFLSWFILGVVIHLQIIPIDATVASRYFYFPFIGLLALVGLFIQQLRVSTLQRKLGISVLIIIYVLCATKIITANITWQNQTGIVIRDQQVTKNDYLQELLYSSELIKQEKYEEAYPHAKKAVEIYPNSYYGWNNLGIIYYYTKRTGQAKKAYQKSMNLADYYGTYDNMALLLLEKDSLMKAREFLRKATIKFPNDEKLWGYRIYVEYKTGELEKAKEAAMYYYLLRKDTRSQYLYDRLKQNLPIDL